MWDAVWKVRVIVAGRSINLDPAIVELEAPPTNAHLYVMSTDDAISTDDDLNAPPIDDALLMDSLFAASVSKQMSLALASTRPAAALVSTWPE